MREDSPPTFIRFREPSRPVGAYQRALELAGHVHALLDHAIGARFYLKDRLDKSVTALVMELSRRDWDVQRSRWRYERTALRLATDAAAMLDLLAAQQAAPLDLVANAQIAARRVCSVLAGPQALMR